MRSWALLLICSTTLLSGTDAIKEPETGEMFPAQLTLGEKELRCTDVAHRAKFGINYLALAHYGDSATDVSGTDLDTLRRYWTTSPRSKALIMRFTREVDRERLLKSMDKLMERANYSGPNRNAFKDALTFECTVGTQLTYFANAEGTLRVMHGKKVVGEWQDRGLIEAVWKNWSRKSLGISSDQAAAASTE
jgi:hypothetical protein